MDITKSGSLADLAKGEMPPENNEKICFDREQVKVEVSQESPPVKSEKLPEPEMKPEDLGYDPKDPELAVVTGIEELLAANEHIQRTSFGIPQNARYELPFSRQLRRSIREEFPVDRELYQEADKRERQTITIYLMMRIIGVIIFAATLAAFGAIYWGWFNGEVFFTDEVASPQNFGLAMGLLAGVAIISWGIRHAVRFFFFYFMRDRARALSFKFAKRHSDILSRITENCFYGRRRVGQGDWTVRGRNHMKMALWNAKRAEYLDRYVTTIVWLIRIWVIYMETIFLTLMGVASFVLIAWVVEMIQTMTAPHMGLMTQAIVSFVLLVPTMIYFWVFSGRKGGNFWTEEFRGQIVQQTVDEEHYFDRIGKYVEDLIDESRAKEFGQGKTASVR